MKTAVTPNEPLDINMLSLRMMNCSTARSLVIAPVLSQEDFKEDTNSTVKYRNSTEMWDYTFEDCESCDCVEDAGCEAHETEEYVKFSRLDNTRTHEAHEAFDDMCTDSPESENFPAFDSLSDSNYRPSKPTTESGDVTRHLPSLPSMAVIGCSPHDLSLPVPTAEKDKYLIYASSSKTWIPHEISVKKICDDQTVGRIRRYISKR